jgi:nucleotide-binding universal stress UspA family protein
MSTASLTVNEEPAPVTVDFRNILVATDFSAGAGAALDAALEIARHTAAKLYLVHVIPPELLHFVPAEASDETLRNARTFANGEMQRLIARVEFGSVCHEEIVCEGQIWPKLLECMRSNRIDLLAMGTLGRTCSKKISLGSVADEIYRMTDCPVLTVAPPVDGTPAEKMQFQRLLFPTNFKPHARRAAAFAFSLQCKHTAQLTILHVVEELVGSPQKGNDMVREFLLERMRKIVPALCTGASEPELVVRFGQPVEEILLTAIACHTDLMVLGLRAPKRSAGHLPSATAYKLVCQAPCPILTFRQ